MEKVPDVRAILERSPTIAILGINDAREKAAYYVPEYLHAAGYRVIGVNPKLAGQDLFGERVCASLAEAGDVDLIDVFRRPDLIPAHVPEILAMSPRPRAVWFQLGIRNDEAARALEAEGIVVVQDRCTLAEHQKMGLGAPKK